MSNDLVFFLDCPDFAAQATGTSSIDLCLLHACIPVHNLASSSSLRRKVLGEAVHAKINNQLDFLEEIITSFGTSASLTTVFDVEDLERRFHAAVLELVEVPKEHRDPAKQALCAELFKDFVKAVMHAPLLTFSQKPTFMMLEEALATLSWKGEAAFLKLAQDYARAQCPLLALMFTSPMLGQAYAVNQDHSQALQELESVAYLFESAGSNTAQLSTMQFAESTALVLYSATVEIGFPRPMSNPQSVLSRSFLLLLNLNNRRLACDMLAGVMGLTVEAFVQTSEDQPHLTVSGLIRPLLLQLLALPSWRLRQAGLHGMITTLVEKRSDEGLLAVLSETADLRADTIASTACYLAGSSCSYPQTKEDKLRIALDLASKLPPTDDSHLAVAQAAVQAGASSTALRLLAVSATQLDAARGGSVDPADATFLGKIVLLLEEQWGFAAVMDCLPGQLRPQVEQSLCRGQLWRALLSSSRLQLARQLACAAAANSTALPAGQAEECGLALAAAHQHLELAELARAYPTSFVLWRLVACGAAERGEWAAAVQHAKAAQQLQASQRQALPCEMADLAAAQPLVGPGIADAAEQLVVACGGAGGAAGALAAVRLFECLAAAGRQPRLPAGRAALQATCELMAAQREPDELQRLAQQAQRVLAASPQLAAALGDGEWRQLLHALLAGGRRGAAAGGVAASALAALLEGHRSFRAAAGRLGAWGELLQLALDAVSNAGPASPEEAEAAWARVDEGGAGLLEAPQHLRPALALAGLGFRALPGDAAAAAAAANLLRALAARGRTAEVLIAVRLFNSAPQPPLLGTPAALLSLKRGPLWAGAADHPPQPAAPPRGGLASLEGAASAGTAWRKACAALLHLCASELGGGVDGWAAALSTEEQLVLLRVLQQAGGEEEVADLCALIDVGECGPEEAAEVLNAAVSLGFRQHAARLERQLPGHPPSSGDDDEPAWLGRAAAAVMRRVAPRSPAAHEAFAAAKCHAAEFPAGWRDLLGMRSAWGVAPSADTLAWCLRCLARQLRDPTNAEAAELLTKAEAAGLARLWQPAGGGVVAGGEPGGHAAALPPLTAPTIAALLQVHAAAAAALPQRSFAAAAAGVLAAAAERGVPLDGACCEAALECCLEDEQAAAQRQAAAPVHHQQPDPHSPLLPLLERLFGGAAVEALQQAALDGGGPVTLPPPACTVAAAAAALAGHAAGAQPEGAPSQVPDSSDVDAPPGEQASAQQGVGQAQLRAALQRGHLSPAVLAACRAAGAAKLQGALATLPDKQLSKLGKEVGLPVAAKAAKKGRKGGKDAACQLLAAALLQRAAGERQQSVPA